MTNATDERTANGSVSIDADCSGDLIFWSGRSLWSRLIRLRSSSTFSHVGVLFAFCGKIWVIESLESKGVRLVPLEVWNLWVRRGLGRYSRFALQATAQQREVVVDYCLDRVGREYASPRQFVRSFGFMIRRLGRWIGLPDDEDVTRYFCSELVAAALKRAGLHLPKPAVRMTPGDVSLLPFLDKQT